MNKLQMSDLTKTWILDLDGTIVKHNGYKIDGVDSLLPGAKEYIDSIPLEDCIIFLTSRTEEYEKETIEFLSKCEIRYNHILFNMPLGERILINDRKVSGLNMAYAINLERNIFELPHITREL